jgi:hypothetical protein
MQPFDATQFRAWLEEFYRELQPKVPGYFTPVLRASVKAALRSVERELGRKVGGDFDAFIAGYLANLSAAWVGSSQGQLGALLEENALPDDASAALNGRVDEWEEKRAGKEAHQETYSSINAGAVEAYTAAGVAALMWAARGKSCPYCQRMHGRRVPTGKPFIEDSTISLGNGESMHVHGAKTHSPLHRGCDCQVISAG